MFTVEQIAAYGMSELDSVICLLGWLLLNDCFPVVTFGNVFPTEESVFDLFLTSGFCFADGLLDVLKGESPPSMEWIENLPSWTFPGDSHDFWCIYLRIFQKAGVKRYKFYVGSAAATRYGSSGRFGQYRRGNEAVPYLVQVAENDGYVCVQQSLIAWMPKPTAADAPRFRHLVVLLKGIFTIIFWALAPLGTGQARSYGGSETRPWNVEDYAWEGLCSHNPLHLRVLGDLDLTPEEIQANFDATKKKSMANSDQKRDERKANKVYHCEVCNYSFESQPSKDRHLRGSHHKSRLEMKRLGGGCSICNQAFKHLSNLNQHKKSKSHIKKVAALAKRKTSSDT